MTNRDDAALLRLASQHEIPFVVIGGWAVISHGYVRITRDVDLLVPDRPEVHERAAAAMAGVHAKRLDDRAIEPGDAIPPQGWQLLTDLGRIDFLLEGVPPLDFESVLASSLPSEMAGVPFRYAGLPSLVAFKRLAGRPHDQLDLQELEAMHGPLPILPVPGLDSE